MSLKRGRETVSEFRGRPDKCRGPAQILDVFVTFLYLGCTAFGGPVAHRARFRELLVRDPEDDAGRDGPFLRVRLDPQLFEDLWVFANLLPGPSSSQVGMAIGRIHAGPPGAFAAWLGFTLPTALLAWAGGTVVFLYRSHLPPGLVAGLLVAVFVVILNAVRTMLIDHQKQLSPMCVSIWRSIAKHSGKPDWKQAVARYCRDDGLHGIIAAASCFVIVLALSDSPLLGSMLALVTGMVSTEAASDWVPQTLLQMCQFAVIVLGLAAGVLLFPGDRNLAPVTKTRQARRASVGFGWLILFFLLLGAAVLAWNLEPRFWLADLAARFYRVGSLVFGGGHVVLPLLEAEVVPTGFVDREVFLSGYGAIQALPGPLFAFATFLGTVATPAPGAAPGGWVGGLMAVAAIFAPSLLLVSGLLDVFLKHRDHPLVRRALKGANAAVVGILGAALWPIWEAASGKWQSLGLVQPVFWLSSLLLLALLIGIPVPDRIRSAPHRERSVFHGSRLRAFLGERADSTRVKSRILRVPAPLLVIAAALGGWALGG